MNRVGKVADLRADLDCASRLFLTDMLCSNALGRIATWAKDGVRARTDYMRTGRPAVSSMRGELTRTSPHETRKRVARERNEGEQHNTFRTHLRQGCQVLSAPAARNGSDGPSPNSGTVASRRQWAGGCWWQVARVIYILDYIRVLVVMKSRRQTLFVLVQTNVYSYILVRGWAGVGTQVHTQVLRLSCRAGSQLEPAAETTWEDASRDSWQQPAAACSSWLAARGSRLLECRKLLEVSRLERVGRRLLFWGLFKECWTRESRVETDALLSC